MLPMNTLTLDEIFYLGAVSVYIIRTVCNNIVLFQNCYNNLLGKVLSIALGVRVVQHLVHVIGLLSAIFLRYLMIEAKKTRRCTNESRKKRCRTNETTP